MSTFAEMNFQLKVGDHIKYDLYDLSVRSGYLLFRVDRRFILEDGEDEERMYGVTELTRNEYFESKASNCEAHYYQRVTPDEVMQLLMEM